MKVNTSILLCLISLAVCAQQPNFEKPVPVSIEINHFELILRNFDEDEAVSLMDSLK